MDKKSKIIIVVCVIVIVLAIGIATTIAIINRNPTLNIDGNEKQVKKIDEQVVEDTSTDEMAPSELDELLK